LKEPSVLQGYNKLVTPKTSAQEIFMQMVELSDSGEKAIELYDKYQKHIKLPTVEQANLKLSYILQAIKNFPEDLKPNSDPITNNFLFKNLLLDHELLQAYNNHSLIILHPH
jgi:hypothetical protein